MKVLVTGGDGYKGSALVPALLDKGHSVSSVDIADEYFPADIRDIESMKRKLEGCDAVIHLACLSNDPTAELDPALTKSINLDSMLPLVRAAKEAGVKRFINASSSSVYGVKDELEVTEDMELKPLTDYSRYKAMCEEILLNERTRGFETVSVRPATVCGYSTALRLDLSVHILTLAALRHKKITVFGGSQYRPNIHIQDIVNAYVNLLEAPAEKVDGQVFNVCYRNYTIMETAELIASMIPAEIEVKPLDNDPRSYHVCGDKYNAAFNPVYHSVENAVQTLIEAYHMGKIPEPDDDKYYRVRSIKNMGLAA